MYKVVFIVVVLVFDFFSLFAEGGKNSFEFSDLWKMALKNNPLLSIQKLKVKKANFEILQNKLYPNPEFEFEVEELGFTEESAGNYYVSLMQTIVTAGKRRYAVLYSKGLKKVEELN